MNKNFNLLIRELSKHIPPEEIKKNYIFLTSKKIQVCEYMGIKICFDYSLPRNSFYLIRKEDYEP